jgi:hypothetical protein
MQALASFGFVSSHVESAVSRANALFWSKASCLLELVAASERAVPDGTGDEVVEDGVGCEVEVRTGDEVDDGTLLEGGMADSLVGFTTESKDPVEVAESPSVVVGPGSASMVDVGLGFLLEDVALEVGLAVGPSPEDEESVSVITESKDLVEVAESPSVVIGPSVASLVETGLDSLLEDVALDVGLVVGCSLKDGDSVVVMTESKDLVEVLESPSLVVVCTSLDVAEEAEVTSSDVVEDEGSTNTVVVTTGTSSELVGST